MTQMQVNEWPFEEVSFNGTLLFARYRDVAAAIHLTKKRMNKNTSMNAVFCAAFSLVLAGASMADDFLTPKILGAGTEKTRNMLRVVEMAGVKLPTDNKELYEWARKAAESGNVQGQLLFANMYDEGVVVPRDLAMAAQWYRKAADNGNMYAQYVLGTMYFEGEGVTQDKAKAAEYFGMSAEQGDMRAQFNLGEMYRLGDGVDQDLAQAAEWYKKASDQDMPQASIIYAQMLESGIGVEKNPALAEKLVRKVFDIGDNNLKAEQIGKPSLQPLPKGKVEAALALMSYYSPEMPKTAKEALKWAEQREEKPEAQVLLGLLYEEGDDVPKDWKKAALWLDRAAKQNVSGADYFLARLYYTGGEGLSQDKAKAVSLMEKAAADGHAGAQYDLGCMYYNGDGVAQGKEKAAQYFTQAARQGDAHAQLALGHMLYEGDGVKQNKKDGAAWLRTAAKMGLVAALPGADVELPFAKRILDPEELQEKFKNKDPEVLAENQVLQSMPDLDKYMYQDAVYYGDGDGMGWMSDYEAVDVNKVLECEKNARAGDVESQYTLGCMYYSGKGKGRNLALATQWFEKAAQNGNAKAEYAMGVMTYYGRGSTKQDTFKAVEWFKKAADKGNANAKKALDIIVE